MTRRVAVLRPEPGNAATITRLRAAGLEAVSVPLFEVVPLRWQLPDVSAFDALVLTSANAVRHAGPQLAALAPLPVYAVGKATAGAARASGLRVVAVGRGGAADLTLPPHTLHLGGVDRAAEIGATTIAVYESRALVAPDVTRLRDVIAMLHSPRAARRVRELVDPATLAIVAISQATADAAGPGWREIAVAERPDDDAMIAAIWSLDKAITA